MFRVTVMMLSDMVESVTLLKDTDWQTDSQTERQTERREDRQIERDVRTETDR